MSGVYVDPTYIPGKPLTKGIISTRGQGGRKRPIATSQMQQQGGFPIAAVLAGLASGHKALTQMKPATKAKDALDKSDFKKSHPTLAKIAGKILDAGKAIGYGENGKPVHRKRKSHKRKK